MNENRNLENRIQEIADEIEQSNLSLFIGSGLSTAAGLVSWKALIEPLARDLGIPLESAPDLPTIAQYYCNSNRNRSRINDLIKSEFLRNVQPTSAHREITRLPVRSIWTTNYDHLLEDSFRAAGRNVDVKSEVQQIASRMRGDVVRIYKMHGDAAAPDKATLTLTDYQDYESRNGHFLDCLRSELSQNTFLFMGFGFGDPNIDAVFGRLRTIFSANQRRHFCILKCPERRPGESDADFQPRLRLHDCHVANLQEYGVVTLEVGAYEQIALLLARLNQILSARDDTRTPPRKKAALHSIIQETDFPLPVGAASPTAALMYAVQSPSIGTIYHLREDRMHHKPVHNGRPVEVGDELFFMDFAMEHICLTSPVAGEIVEITVKDNARVAEGETLCFIRRPHQGPKSIYFQRSPVAGTFYMASAPDAEPFVRPGQTIERGAAICLIEAQKTFHQIPAAVSGVVKSINYENEHRVDEGAYLMAIETDAREAKKSTREITRLPFRVQESPVHGRFYRAMENPHAPRKQPGDPVIAGEVVGRIRKLRMHIDVLAEYSGLFRNYLKSDGEHVNPGDPIFAITPDNIVAKLGARYRVQLAETAGIFAPSVEPGQLVSAGQKLGTIGQVKLSSTFDGVILEVAPSGPIKAEQVVVKVAP